MHVRAGFPGLFTQIVAKNCTVKKCRDFGFECVHLAAKLRNWDVTFVDATNGTFAGAISDLNSGKTDFTLPMFSPTMHRITVADFVPVWMRSVTLSFVFNRQQYKSHSSFLWYLCLAPEQWVLLTFAILLLVFRIPNFSGRKIASHFIVFNAVAMITFSTFLFETFVLLKLIRTQKLPFDTISGAKSGISNGFLPVAMENSANVELSQKLFGITDSAITKVADHQDINRLLTKNNRYFFVSSRRYGSNVVKFYPDTLTITKNPMLYLPPFTTSIIPKKSPLKSSLIHAYLILHEAGFPQKLAYWELRGRGSSSRTCEEPLSYDDIRLILRAFCCALVVCGLVEVAGWRRTGRYNVRGM